MISVIDVKIQAANPTIALFPWRAFVGSPSSLRVRNVPKRIGLWNINEVYVNVLYPNQQPITKQCVLVGGVWVATIDGTDTVGYSEKGYAVFANGVDEDGNEVRDYCLGRGDVEIVSTNGIVTPETTGKIIYIYQEQPEEPKDGDMWYDGDKYVLYYNGQATEIGGGFEPTTEQLAAMNSGITAEKVDSMLDDQDVKDIVLEKKTISEGDWSCEPSEYYGSKIELVYNEELNSYSPYVDGSQIGGDITPPTYPPTDGMTLTWTGGGDWSGEEDLVATYHAGESENALGLVTYDYLSANTIDEQDVKDIVLEETEAVPTGWSCEPSEYYGSKIEIIYEEIDNAYLPYVDGSSMGAPKIPPTYPPTDGMSLTWEAGSEWSGGSELVATYHEAKEPENVLGLVTYDYLSANAVPKYVFETATEAGAITLKPYTSTSLTSTGTNFTVAIETSTENKSRECMLVVEASVTAPTITWPENFHPRTDSATDFACETGINVYWISEYKPDHFVVARWLETTGGSAT